MAGKKKSGSGEREPGLIEVWLSDPEHKRPPFGHETKPLEYLPDDGSAARAGDIIHLPRNVTGDTKKQAFEFGGTRTPFRVIECGHVYARDKGEVVDPMRSEPRRARADHHARQAPQPERGLRRPRLGARARRLTAAWPATAADGLLGGRPLEEVPGAVGRATSAPDATVGGHSFHSRPSSRRPPSRWPVRPTP